MRLFLSAALMTSNTARAAPVNKGLFKPRCSGCNDMGHTIATTIKPVAKQDDRHGHKGEEQQQQKSKLYS
jgi:hypothetical protein